MSLAQLLLICAALFIARGTSPRDSLLLGAILAAMSAALVIATL